MSTAPSMFCTVYHKRFLSKSKPDVWICNVMKNYSTMQQQILIQNQTSEMIENHYMTDFYFFSESIFSPRPQKRSCTLENVVGDFLFFWWVNFQSPTQKKIMYVRESSRDATVQLWVVIFMSAYLPDAGFTKFAAGLWTIKDLCKFLVYLLQWTYSLRGYVVYSEALNFIHLQFHEIFSRFLIF